MVNNFKQLIKEERAQVSLEFLIILGIVALAAVAVGFYLKQVSAKNVDKVTTIQDETS